MYVYTHIWIHTYYVLYILVVIMYMYRNPPGGHRAKHPRPDVDVRGEGQHQELHQVAVAPLRAESERGPLFGSSGMWCLRMCP